MGTKFLLTILSLVQKLMGLISGAFARISPDKYAPNLVWPKPTGSYKVGILDDVIEDTGRKDPHGTGNRRLPVKIWYPANVNDEARQRALMSNWELPIMIKGMTKAMPISPFMVKRLGQTVTNSYENAPAIEGSFPLILFNEGFAGIISQNSHLCEDLASHGYIVMSVDHPGGAAATAFPDGAGLALKDDLRAMMMSPDLMKPALGMKKSKNFSDRLDALKGYLDFAPLEAEGRVWVDDLTGALNALEASKVSPALQSVISNADLGKIAVAGMSFGGAASAAFAHQDSRVTCAINLDGGQFGTELLESPIKCPLLMIHSSFATFPDGGGYNDFFYDSLDQPSRDESVYRFVVEDSGHIDFTDMTIFGHGPVAKLLGLGGIDGLEMLQLTAATVRQFLDSELGDDEAQFDVSGLINNHPSLQQQDMSAIRAWRSAQ